MRIALDTVASLLLSGLILFACWLALYHLLPDHNHTQTSPSVQGSAGQALRSTAGRKLQMLIGRGVVRGDALTITGYEFHATNHNAVAIRRGSLQASDFPYLQYSISAAFPGPAMNFIWRNASEPRTVHSQALNTRADSPSVLALKGLDGWEGTIIEVGVHVASQDPAASVHVERLQFSPHGWRLALASQVSAWTAFRGWNQRSINYLTGKNAENGLSPLPVIATWAALSALVLFAIGILRGSQAPVAYALVALAGWLTADILWQRELNAQLATSRDVFAGKSMQERHEADLDAWVYRYIMRLKSSVLPAEPARVVIIHDTWKHHYDRLKAQYYLLPHNVYNFKSGLENGAYQRGDYILVMRDASNPVLDENAQQLVWRDGLRVSIRILDRELRGALYQVLEAPERPASS